MSLTTGYINLRNRKGDHSAVVEYDKWHSVVRVGVTVCGLQGPTYPGPGQVVPSDVQKHNVAYLQENGWA